MTDLTTRILIEIRDEARRTNERLDQTNERLDQTVERLDRLEQRQTEGEIRISTAITDVVGAIHEVRDAVIVDRKLAQRLDDHERRITTLEQGDH